MSDTGLIQWIQDENSREALISNIAEIANFYERDILQLFWQCGKESSKAYLESVGLYHSRALRYASMKRKSVYEAIINFGNDHYKHVSQTNALEQLDNLLRMGLHIAVLREELRE